MILRRRCVYVYVATTRPQKEQSVIVDSIESIEDFYSPLNAYTLLEDESYTGWLLHTYAHQAQKKKKKKKPSCITFIF